ncbi:MAG: hypothetical protein ACOYL5_07455 [Phototrophicaceae bacterium]
MYYSIQRPEYEVTRLQDKPVIIFRLLGIINRNIAKQIFEDTLLLMQNVSGKFFRINIVSNVESDFEEMLEVIKRSARETGGTADPRVQLIFVGTSRWVPLFIDMMAKPEFGAVKIPQFATLEEALDYVDERLGQSTPAHPDAATP